METIIYIIRHNYPISQSNINRVFFHLSEKNIYIIYIIRRIHPTSQSNRTQERKKEHTRSVYYSTQLHHKFDIKMPVSTRVRITLNRATPTSTYLLMRNSSTKLISHSEYSVNFPYIYTRTNIHKKQILPLCNADYKTCSFLPLFLHP